MAYFYRRPPRFLPRYDRFQNTGGLLVTPHVLDVATTVRPAGFVDVRSTNGVYTDQAGIRQTAGANAPRYDNKWNGSTWVPNGLLVEPAATNLLPSSDNLGNATYWSPNGLTLSTSSTLSADRSHFMTQAVCAASSSPQDMFNGTGITPTANQQFSVAVDFKRVNWDFVFLTIEASGTSAFVTLVIDLTNKIVSQTGLGASGGAISVTPTIETLANGIVRVNFVGTVNTTTTFFYVVGAAPAGTGNTFDVAGSPLPSSAFAGTETFLVDAADCVASTVPTTHVVTGTTSATRNADAVSFTLGGSTTGLQFTFDDGSTQTVTGLTGGSTYTIPTTLNRQRILLIDNVSSAAINLDAGSGSFALTGRIATINVGLPAPSGSYALTGNNASINVGLAAGSGAFSLVGFSATDAVGEPLGSGSYALTGGNAGLKVGLPAASGAYSLTGNSASLIAIRKLPAASGTFALTGYSTTISVGLPVSSGSYALTGNTATINVGLGLSSGAFSLVGFSAGEAVNLALGSGSYALTGNPAGLNAGLPLGKGTYNLTGNSASLIAIRKLPAASGSYALTGYSATINVSLPASSGSYALTGRNLGINVGMPAGSGSYILTGNPADLVYTPAGVHINLAAGSGAFALTGNPATLAVQVAVPGGTFALTGGTLSFQVNEPLGSGAYSLTGHEAGLAVGLPLGSGAYVLTGNDADLHTAVLATLSLSGATISVAFDMTAIAQLFRRKYPLFAQPKPSGTFVSIPYEAEIRKADPHFYRDRRNAPEYDIGRRLFTGNPEERGAYAGDPAPTNIFSETTPDLSGLDLSD